MRKPPTATSSRWATISRATDWARSARYSTAIRPTRRARDRPGVERGQCCASGANQPALALSGLPDTVGRRERRHLRQPALPDRPERRRPVVRDHAHLRDRDPGDRKRTREPPGERVRVHPDRRLEHQRGHPDGGGGSDRVGAQWAVRPALRAGARLPDARGGRSASRDRVRQVLDQEGRRVKPSAYDLGQRAPGRRRRLARMPNSPAPDVHADGAISRHVWVQLVDGDEPLSPPVAIVFAENDCERNSAALIWRQTGPIEPGG